MHCTDKKCRHSGKFAFLPLLAKMRIYPESDLLGLLTEREPNRIPHKFSLALRRENFAE
jgi:hypothetical protein